jgi:hypothetical protein
MGHEHDLVFSHERGLRAMIPGTAMANQCGLRLRRTRSGWIRSRPARPSWTSACRETLRRASPHLRGGQRGAAELGLLDGLQERDRAATIGRAELA